MPRKKTTDLKISLRITDDFLPRLDALAERLSPAGVALSRSDAVRAALSKGLDAFEAESKRGRGGKS